MRNWYQQCRQKIEKLYGSDADLFCDLLAATSPRKHVKANWKLAEQIYGSYKVGCLNLDRCLPAHIPNVLRALRREELSGRKVRSFAANLKGDLNVVTVDVWICRYFGIKKLTDKVYGVIELVIKYNARIKGLTPAELQAQLWCDALCEVGRKPVSFLSAIDNQMKFWED